VEISALSQETILVPVQEVVSGTVVDTTTYPVQMALLGDTVQPGDSDWLPAVWETNSLTHLHSAAVTVGPGTTLTLIANKSYRPWVKVFAPSETPVLKCPGLVRVLGA
jgi:hypothetical protein